MEGPKGLQIDTGHYGLQDPSYSSNFILNLTNSACSDDSSVRFSPYKDSPVKGSKFSPWNSSNFGSEKSSKSSKIKKTKSPEFSPVTHSSPRPKSTPWTSQPQPLRKEVRALWWNKVAIDAVMIILPLPFFILAAIVVYLNGKHVEAHDLSMLQSSIKAATTIFPILFAAITGRAAIKFATWKLEQGATLGLLEQLMGSRTVASTVLTQLRLRSFDIFGLGLVLLWALSPLGSQAVLRILSAPVVPVSAPITVMYINTRQQSYASLGGAFLNSWFALFEMMFGASLLAPPAVRDGSMDLWGNVKIPYYSSVLTSGASANGDGWIQIPSDFTPSYSSVLGIPIDGIAMGNTTFNIESTYMEFTCENQTTVPQTQVKSELISPKGPFVSAYDIPTSSSYALGYKGPDVTAYNATGVGNGTYTRPQNCPDCLTPNVTSSMFDPGILLYQEFDGFENTTSLYCVPSQNYVESTVSCQKTLNSQLCSVTAQRPSQLPHMPDTLTWLSFPQIALSVTGLLPNSTPQFTVVSPIQSYLYEPFSQIDLVAADGTIAMDENRGISGLSLLHDQVPIPDFSDHLGQLINAFIQGSQWNSTSYIIGASFNNINAIETGGNAASFIPATTPGALTSLIQNRTAAFTVPATLTLSRQIYRCSYPWAFALLLSSLGMLASSILSVIFSRITVVPDYLGYVSSLAKESPYVRMPDGGANLDGMDRARLMKGLRVRLGNVDSGRGSRHVGRLAFARAEDTGVVRKDSFYV